MFAYEQRLHFRPFQDSARTQREQGSVGTRAVTCLPSATGAAGLQPDPVIYRKWKYVG